MQPEDITPEDLARHDRLTKLSGEMLSAFALAAGHDDKAVVLLSDGHIGALSSAGYKTDAQILRAVLRYVQLACAANGARLVIVKSKS